MVLFHSYFSLPEGMGDFCHLVVAPQGNHEVGFFLVEHGVIVGRGSDAATKLGHAVGSD